MAETTTSNPVASRSSVGAGAEDDRVLTLDQLFAEIDTGGDGSIGFREFAEWWAQRQMASKGQVEENILEQAWKLFEKYDRDHDQQIDQAEFDAVLDDLAQSEWRKADDPTSGRQYWVNPTTRESTWDRPTIKGFMARAGVANIIKRGGKKYDAAAANTNDDGDHMEMLLNMWSIYLRFDRKETKKFYTDLALFIVYISAMGIMIIGMLPISTTFLKHQEALADFLLDEEFEGVSNHKKSWYDVMTEEELWQWVEEPLYGAFYEDSAPNSACDGIPCLNGTEDQWSDREERERRLAWCRNQRQYQPCANDQPGPLLMTNVLVGRIQFRSIRVTPHKCPDLNWMRKPVYGLTEEQCKDYTWQGCEDNKMDGQFCAGKGEDAATGEWVFPDSEGQQAEGVFSPAQQGVPYTTCLLPNNLINTCAGAWSGPKREALPTYYEELAHREKEYKESKRRNPGVKCNEDSQCRSGHCSKGLICTAYDDPSQVDWWNTWGMSYLANCGRDAASIDQCQLSAASADNDADKKPSADALLSFASPPEKKGEWRGGNNTQPRFMSSLGYSGLSGSTELVPNLIGRTGAAEHKYGDFGYAVTLPRDRHGWRATVCKMQGKVETCREESETKTDCFVKLWDDQTEMHQDPTWTGLHTVAANEYDPTKELQNTCEAEVEKGSCMCLDNPGGAVPFIDKYTRMVAITMAVHNANDFDVDDPGKDQRNSTRFWLAK